MELSGLETSLKEKKIVEFKKEMLRRIFVKEREQVET
jgi:hypothetical protein